MEMLWSSSSSLGTINLIAYRENVTTNLEEYRLLNFLFILTCLYCTCRQDRLAVYGCQLQFVSTAPGILF
jgi:hypothetical protein